MLRCLLGGVGTRNLYTNNQPNSFKISSTEFRMLTLQSAVVDLKGQFALKLGTNPFCLLAAELYIHLDEQL